MRAVLFALALALPLLLSACADSAEAPTLDDASEAEAYEAETDSSAAEANLDPAALEDLEL